MDLLPDCLAETLLNSVKNNAASLSCVARSRLRILAVGTDVEHFTEMTQ